MCMRGALRGEGSKTPARIQQDLQWCAEWCTVMLCNHTYVCTFLFVWILLCIRSDGCSVQQGGHACEYHMVLWSGDLVCQHAQDCSRLGNMHVGACPAYFQPVQLISCDSADRVQVPALGTPIVALCWHQVGLLNQRRWNWIEKLQSKQRVHRANAGDSLLDNETACVSSGCTQPFATSGARQFPTRRHV